MKSFIYLGLRYIYIIQYNTGILEMFGKTSLVNTFTRKVEKCRKFIVNLNIFYLHSKEKQIKIIQVSSHDKPLDLL